MFAHVVAYNNKSTHTTPSKEYHKMVLKICSFQICAVTATITTCLLI